MINLALKNVQVYSLEEGEEAFPEIENALAEADESEGFGEDS